MIVDTSALIAVIRNEPEAERFAELISKAERVRLSVVGYVEAGVVLDSADNPVVTRQFERLIDSSGIELEAVTPQQARLARAAYRDFGKGTGHPAALNFGDCFSYALASETAEPLLFKGDDFARTDLKPAAV